MPSRNSLPSSQQQIRHRWQQRSDDILAAAADLFARRGFQGTDVQVLADALGIGKGTVYRHFPTKRELFLATVDRGMQRLHEHVEKSAAQATDPLDRVQRAIEAYLAFFDTRPEFVELLIQERAVFKDRKKPTYFAHREKNVGRWRELFAGLIAAGRIRPLPVEQITDVLSGLLYGTMFTNYFARRQRPPATQARELWDIALLGILSDQERRKQCAPQRDSRKTKESSR
jgi:AcrR family transcriptional regulator